MGGPGGRTRLLPRIVAGLMLASLATPGTVQAAGHPQPLAEVVGRVSLVVLVTSRGQVPGAVDSVRLSVDRVFKGRAADTLNFADVKVATVMPAGSRWIIFGDTRNGVTRGEFWRVLPNGRITDVGVVENPGTVEALTAWFASAPATSTQPDRRPPSDPPIAVIVFLASLLGLLAFMPASHTRREGKHR